jgi:hypothetical protein
VSESSTGSIAFQAFVGGGSPGLAPGSEAIVMLEDDDAAPAADPGTVILTCANCGAAMDERKCKLICRCGYFLSCSDYY